MCCPSSAMFLVLHSDSLDRVIQKCKAMITVCAGRTLLQKASKCRSHTGTAIYGGSCKTTPTYNLKYFKAGCISRGKPPLDTFSPKYPRDDQSRSCLSVQTCKILSPPLDISDGYKHSPMYAIMCNTIHASYVLLSDNWIQDTLVLQRSWQETFSLSPAPPWLGQAPSCPALTSLYRMYFPSKYRLSFCWALQTHYWMLGLNLAQILLILGLRQCKHRSPGSRIVQNLFDKSVPPAKIAWL